MSLERHYTVAEASTASGFPRRAIYDAIESKQIAYVRLGKGLNSRIRIAESALVAWLARHTEPVSDEKPPRASVSALMRKPSRPRAKGRFDDMLPAGYKPRWSVQ